MNVNFVWLRFVKPFRFKRGKGRKGPSLDPFRGDFRWKSHEAPAYEEGLIAGKHCMNS